MQRKGKVEDSLMQRYQYSELEADCEQAFTEEELKQHRAGFEQFVKEECVDDLAPPEKTFCKLLAPYVKNMTGTDFEADTGVRRVKLRKILDGKFNNPEVRTVVAICAGLNLDITMWKMTMKQSSRKNFICVCRRKWCGAGMYRPVRTGRSVYTAVYTVFRRSWSAVNAETFSGASTGIITGVNPLSGGVQAGWKAQVPPVLPGRSTKRNWSRLC